MTLKWHFLVCTHSTSLNKLQLSHKPYGILVSVYLAVSSDSCDLALLTIGSCIAGILLLDVEGPFLPVGVGIARLGVVVGMLSAWEVDDSPGTGGSGRR